MIACTSITYLKTRMQSVHYKNVIYIYIMFYHELAEIEFDLFFNRICAPLDIIYTCA